MIDSASGVAVAVSLRLRTLQAATHPRRYQRSSPVPRRCLVAARCFEQAAEPLLRRTAETKTEEGFSKPSANRDANLQPHKQTTSKARRQTRSNCDRVGVVHAWRALPHLETTGAATRLRLIEIATRFARQVSIQTEDLDRCTPIPSLTLRGEKADH